MVPQSVKAKGQEVPSGRETEVGLGGLRIDVEDRVDLLLVAGSKDSSNHAIEMKQVRSAHRHIVMIAASAGTHPPYPSPTKM